MKTFPSPSGTFLLSIVYNKETKEMELVKFPSPSGTFLLSMNKEEMDKRYNIRFRPHRGLFFYL